MPGWIDRLFSSPAAAVPDAAARATAARAVAEECKNRGNACLLRGETEAAMESYREAIATDPTYADAYNNLGFALSLSERAEEATGLLRQALALDPGIARAHYNLGVVLHRKGERGEARAHFEEAIRLKPDFAEAYNDLGILAKEAGGLEQARACFESAAAANGGFAAAHSNLGALKLADFGAPEDAAQSLRRALAVDPANANARFNLSQALLAIGQWQEGWALYESRFHVDEQRSQRRPFPQPPWRGEALEGKGLLVWGDQGIGDEMLFANMFPDIVAHARRCVIECTPKLAPLFVRSFPAAVVVPRSDPPHPATQQGIDFQIAAADAAQWLRPSLESFPRRDAYLSADPARVAYWRARLDRLGSGLKVGFCWRSGLRGSFRSLHYTSLEQWGPIFAVPGVHFVNLQYDDCAAELEAARLRFGVPLHAFPEVDLFNDLDEAAALSKAMDLVISAPTAASSLAAAQGVPTWEMGYGTTWVHLGADYVPWLPSLRLFMRRWDQPWDDVIAALAQQLKNRQIG